MTTENKHWVSTIKSGLIFRMSLSFVYFSYEFYKQIGKLYIVHNTDNSLAYLCQYLIDEKSIFLSLIGTLLKECVMDMNRE